MAITLPAKFEEENEKRKNKPSLLVELQSDVLAAEKFQQTDWEANTGESNVDYTPTPPEAGQVELAETTGSLSQTLIANSVIFPINFSDFVGQGFIVSTKDAYITSIRLKVWDWPYGESATMTVRTSQSGGVIGSKSQNLYIGSYVDVTFTFDVPIPVQAGVTYWFTFGFTDPLTRYEGEVRMRKNTPFTSGYCFFYQSAGSGFYYQFYEYDLDFTINYKRYQDSGYIETDNFDVGETPVEDGELQVDDVVPGNSSILYYLRASDVGSFLSGDTSSLGYYADGDAITDLHQHYRARAEFTSTSDNLETPTLSSIRLDFSNYQRYESRLNLGYEPSVLAVDALETTIDDFEESTIGEIGVQLAHTPSVSNWLATKHPKNKIVRVLAGFAADGFMRTDYIDYFVGQVDDYSIGEDDTVSLSLKDATTEWDKNVPLTWEDTGDDVVWTGSHHTDVMIDILTNYMGVRDSKIEFDSFTAVKSDTSSWGVTRKVTGNPANGGEMLNDLRRLLSSHFIPRPNGRVSLKRCSCKDFNEFSVVASFTDDDLVSKSYAGNLDDTWNEVAVYFAWSSSGDNTEDFNNLYTDVDSDAKVRHAETRLFEFKDKWTSSAGSGQVQDMADVVMNRYVEPPPIVDVEVDRRYVWLEVADLVALSTSRAPVEYRLPEWTRITTAADPSIRYEHRATVVASIMYVFGGVGSGPNMLQDLWSYDPTSDAWTEVGTYSDERKNFGMAAIGDAIYFHGGQSSGSPFAQQGFFTYNVNSDIWTATASSPTGLMNHRLSSIGNDFYMPAGFTGFDYTDNGFKYDSVVDTWTNIASFRHVQDYSMVIYEGELYVYGGMYNAVASVMNDLWKYNPSSDSWTLITTGPQLYSHEAVVISDSMYVFGGHDGTIQNSAFYEYDFSNGTWSRIDHEVPERHMHAAVEIGGLMYVYGGWTNETSEALQDFWQYRANSETLPFEDKVMQVIRRELDFEKDTIALSLKYVPIPLPT